MAFIVCPVHGQGETVFVFKEDATCFPLNGEHSESSADWTVYCTSLEGLIDWQILIKRSNLQNPEIKSIGEGMIDKSLPICKRCVEQAFNSKWAAMKVDEFYLSESKWLIWDSEKIIESLSEIDESKVYPHISGDYYNEASSYLSVSITKIFSRFFSSEKYWYDDILISRLQKNGESWRIWGAVILGKVGKETVQFVDPIYVEVDLLPSSDIKLSIGDKNFPKITYTEFQNNRGRWDRDYYSNEEWDPNERDWANSIVIHDKRM